MSTKIENSFYKEVDFFLARWGSETYVRIAVKKNKDSQEHRQYYYYNNISWTLLRQENQFSQEKNVSAIKCAEFLFPFLQSGEIIIGKSYSFKR